MDTQTEIEAIAAASRAYEENVNAGDVEGYLAVWHDEGIQMPPNAPVVVGKDALRAKIEKGFPLFTRKMKINTQETVVAGEWAYVYCFYTVEMTPKAGGDTTFFDGKDLAIYRKDDAGEWKLYRDCFNSNTP